MRRGVLLASAVTVALLVVGVALLAGVAPSVRAAFGATSSCTPTEQEYGGCTVPPPSCTVSSSPPTGCLTFPSETLSGNNNVYPNSGWTLTLNAVFSFDSSQSGNFSSFPNDYATGGGSYVIRNASGTIVEQGTLTANNGSAGSSEGLATALYLNDSVLIGSCSAANRRDLAVDASTSHGAFMYVSGTGYTGSTPGYTSQSYVTTNSYGSFSLDPSPVTVGC